MTDIVYSFEVVFRQTNKKIAMNEVLERREGNDRTCPKE